MIDRESIKQDQSIAMGLRDRSGAAMMQPETARRPEVGRAISDMEEQVRMLIAAIEMLEDRLSPVLMTPGPKSEKESERSFCTAIATAIGHQADTIESLTRLVVDLVERVQV